MKVSAFALARTVCEYLRTSLWVVPAVMAVAAVALALAMLVSGFSLASAEVWWLHSGNGRDASRLMATLLSSMMTMMTLVVSITVVVLTLAANQLGPRLIRSFVSDRRTQFSLGALIATIAYHMLVLRSLDGAMPAREVPHLAVTVGSGLSLLCVGVLLYFVHHLTRSIVADEIIDRVGAEAEKFLDGWTAEGQGRGDAEWPSDAGAGAHLGVSGYVQFVDAEHIVRAAREAEAAVVLGFRAGDHLLPEQACLRVIPAHALSDALTKKIANGIVVGSQRTTTQDIEFGFRQIVEIALRALSPSMNDPFTAIAAIDRLARLLAKAQTGKAPEPVHRDADGTARLFTRRIGFADLLNAAFLQILHASGGKLEILERMLSILATLAERARTDDQRQALLKLADRGLAVGRRTIAEAEDVAVIESIRARISAMAGHPD